MNQIDEAKNILLNKVCDTCRYFPDGCKPMGKSTTCDRWRACRENKFSDLNDLLQEARLKLGK